MTAILLPLLFMAVLIALNGLFVAAEFAIVSVPRTRIAQLAEDDNRAAQRTLKVLLEPVLQNYYIATAQVGITIVSLALGAYGEHVLAGWFQPTLERFGSLGAPLAHTIATILSVVLLTYFHVVIGEMIPKTLALHAAEPTVLALARPMQVVGAIFLPIVWLFNLIGNGIVRLMGIRPAHQNERLFTPDELEFIVEESLESGLLDSSEQLFIENIFDLPQRTVEHVMTPRTQLHCIPLNADEHTVLRRICEARKTRYPIYDTDLDHIIGILHLKDFARHRQNPQGPLDLQTILRPAIFVPQNLMLDRMLLNFQRENIQLAIVVDEFGGTAGLISLEDLVEEVVGEIQDEFDDEILPIEILGERELRVRGDLILDELDQLYAIEFGDTEAYTVGGLVMELLGRIPNAKDRVTYKGIGFEVESTERLAVQSVLIHLPEENPGDEG